MKTAREPSEGAAGQVLPRTIPIFPLTGAILLPGAHLPLNIFEPRYLAMIDAARAGDGMIGMIQPRGSMAEQRPELYEIGCVGTIAEYEETPDGRYLISLLGLRRFRIVDELSVETLFRQVHADYGVFDDVGSDEPLDGKVRDRLEDQLKDYLDMQGLGADWDAVKGTDDVTLVNALAMICPFLPPEKQALLEAPNAKQRAQVLITLMQLAQSDHSINPKSRH